MDRQKQLIRRFHTLLAKARVDNEGKAVILAAYGVTSTKEMTPAQLEEACAGLASMADPRLAEADRLRRRLFAAIASYLEATGRTPDPATIKAVACRAARRRNFNDIPPDRLRSLYGAFTNRRRDIALVPLYADTQAPDTPDTETLN